MTRYAVSNTAYAFYSLFFPQCTSWGQQWFKNIPHGFISLSAWIVKTYHTVCWHIHLSQLGNRVWICTCSLAKFPLKRCQTVQDSENRQGRLCILQLCDHGFRWWQAADLIKGMLSAAGSNVERVLNVPCNEKMSKTCYYTTTEKTNVHLVSDMGDTS